MILDFRTVDLIDRMDWDDPDFPAAVRMLGKISNVVHVKVGQANVSMHVIGVYGDRALGPDGKPLVVSNDKK